MDNKNIQRSRSDIVPLLALGLVACGGGGSGGSGTTTGATTAPVPHGPPPAPPAPVIPRFVPPDDISLGFFENHPTNRPIYDLTPQGQTDGTYRLTPSYGDNARFTVSADGRIWFKISPDFENPTDKNADHTYNIRIEHPHNGQTYSDIDVDVQDIAIELTPGERQGAGRKPYYNFSYAQVENILPANDFVKYLLNGGTYALPQSGPLTFTWSLEVPSSVLDPRFPAPTTDSQEKIDDARQKLNMAFAEFEAAANLKFIEVADTATVVGDIRFFFNAGVTGGNALGYAITLGPTSQYTTYVHEIGHVLSLKHPFESRGSGFPFDLELRDGAGSERSVVSYNDSVHTENTGLQPADIAALQYLYGDAGTDFNGLQATLIADGVTPVIL